MLFGLTFFLKNNMQGGEIWIITPFKTVFSQHKYTEYLTVIKNFMNNANTLTDSGTVTKNKFKGKL